MSAHEPRFPTWRCKVCRDPWPCGTARAELYALYADSLATLELNLSLLMVEASRDLRRDCAGSLYDRFVGWLDLPVCESKLGEDGQLQIRYQGDWRLWMEAA
jgi:hypothetical protein